MTITAKHKCHWPDCPLEVHPSLWGCTPHWFKLPYRLRQRVWDHYRPGQEIDKKPSKEYVAVALEIQAWIRKEEAK